MGAIVALRMFSMAPSEKNYTRIVVKAGTNVLTSKGERLDRDAMSALAGQVAAVMKAGAEPILVTSGAIAAGREAVKRPKGAKGVGVSQMLAAVGQSRLMHAYQELFAEHDVVVAQALLTHQDVEDRSGYLNVRNTLTALLAEGVVLAEPRVLPVVPVAEHGVLDLAHEHEVLGVAVVGRRAGQVPVEEQAELHLWCS